MKAWTLCNSSMTNQQGNIITWSNLTEDSTLETVTLESVENFCKGDLPVAAILPGVRTFQNSIKTCLKLQAPLYVYKDKLSTVFPKIVVDKHHRLWTGFQLDDQNEYTLSSLKTQKKLRFEETNLKWKKGEPNGGKLEKCIVISQDRNETEDMSCVTDQFTTCYLNSDLTLRLQNFK